ncbi:MAG TPA: hypothetical protein VFA10_11000 [Ktedonobacteraceae bacterium]|nr:hypothetical protein [Ktedonobacteraceae bacterium]
MEEKTGQKWLWRIVDFVNPLRDPSLTVAAVLTFIEEAGQHDPWYWYIIIALINWLAVRGVVWLVVNFTFASTFVSRRLWWAVQHPRLAWRILDAIGHEEIVIGGLPALGEGVLLQDGTTVLSPALGASGIHIIGELPAGTELPLLGMPNGQMAPDFSALTASGLLPPLNGGNFGATNSQALPDGVNMYGSQRGPESQPLSHSSFVSTRGTEDLPQSFPQRPSEQEERLREQLAAYARFLDDWVQFTEEKWRTVSDSQLGWKPLRGRWSNWEDIFQDVYAAKTSDPMAHAAQSAGEATARRFDSSKEKGSAAAAVACFMRDMMTLRKGIELMQQSLDQTPETPTVQPIVQPRMKGFGGNSTNGSFKNGSSLGVSSRNSLIRRPAQIFVDADAEH